MGEIERLRCRKEELEASVSSLGENLISLSTEKRKLEDDAAKLHKKRVRFKEYKTVLCYMLQPH